MNAERIKKWFTFDLPIFGVWILKQPFRELKGVLIEVKSGVGSTGKPKSAMTIFFGLLVFSAFLGKLRLVAIATIGFVISWIMYHYQTKEYVKDYRENYKERAQEPVKESEKPV